MSDTITQLNIFRYAEFWRMNTRNTYSQNCYGGIMTIIFFISVGILSVLKLR